MKKAFTLVEIIISITIIAVIGIFVTFFIFRQDNNSDIEKINSKVLQATQVYINTEVKNQKTILNDIYDYAKGAKIPLQNLVTSGLITESDAEKIYSSNSEKLNNKESDFYILAVNDPEYDCESLTYILSWTMENNNEVVYLCDNNNTEEGEKSLYDVIVSPDLNSTEYSSIVYVSGENLSDDGKGVYYYKGDVKNNYLKIQGLDSKLFRIVRTVENKNLKIIETSTLNFAMYTHAAFGHNEPFTQWNTGEDNWRPRYTTVGYEIEKYYTGSQKASTSDWIYYSPCPDATNTNSWSDSTQVKMYRFDADPSVCSTESSIRMIQSPYYTYIYEPLLKNYNNIKATLETYIDMDYKWCDTGSTTSELSEISFKCQEDKTIVNSFGLLNSFEYKAVSWYKSDSYYLFQNKVGSSRTTSSSSELVMDLKNGWLRAGAVLEKSEYWGWTTRQGVYLRPTYVIKGTSKIISGTGTETDPYIIDGFVDK